MISDACLLSGICNRYHMNAIPNSKNHKETTSDPFLVRPKSRDKNLLYVMTNKENLAKMYNQFYLIERNCNRTGIKPKFSCNVHENSKGNINAKSTSCPKFTDNNKNIRLGIILWISI